MAKNNNQGLSDAEKATADAALQLTAEELEDQILESELDEPESHIADTWLGDSLVIVQMRRNNIGAETPTRVVIPPGYYPAYQIKQFKDEASQYKKLNDAEKLRLAGYGVGMAEPPKIAVVAINGGEKGQEVIVPAGTQLAANADLT